MTAEPDFSATVHLLGKFKSGDREAVNVLYNRYFERLHAVVRMRLGPALRARTESVDIVQDAFLASLRGLEDVSCQNEGDFFHWLCKIAENRIRDKADHVFAAKRDAALERPLEPARPSGQSFFGPIQELARHTHSPASKIVRQEDLQRLETAIDALPDIQKEALLLVRYEGLSQAQAGEKLGRSPDAVRMLVARAIVALGKAMADNRESG
ncbi:MAG: sigma-70 family RNA polymerase sigma factor [Planctomycetes bacterium]|nr:sigma-70 family RNA polymerase sigma factor [Planctomycetota bacterium]